MSIALRAVGNNHGVFFGFVISLQIQQTKKRKNLEIFAEMRKMLEENSGEPRRKSQFINTHKEKTRIKLLKRKKKYAILQKEQMSISCCFSVTYMQKKETLNSCRSEAFTEMNNEAKKTKRLLKILFFFDFDFSTFIQFWSTSLSRAWVILVLIFFYCFCFAVSDVRFSVSVKLFISSF